MVFVVVPLAGALIFVAGMLLRLAFARREK
jgi:hypothetical protein